MRRFHGFRFCLALVVTCDHMGRFGFRGDNWVTEANQIIGSFNSIPYSAGIMARVKSVIFFTLWIGAIITGISLGEWQIHRLAWKTSWLNKIDEAYSYPLDLKEWQESDLPCTSTDRTFFIRTSENVTYNSTRTANWTVRPRIVDGMFGQYIFTKATFSNGIQIWVNRGFVPDGVNIPPPPNSAHITLQIRATDITPATILAQNSHLTSMDLSTRSGCDPLAIIGVIEQTPPQSAWPQPVGSRPTPPNDHLSYAIFWFALSGIAGIIGMITIFNSHGKKLSFIYDYVKIKPLDN